MSGPAGIAINAAELRTAHRMARMGYEPPAWPACAYTLPSNCRTLAALRARCALPDGLQGCWLWAQGMHSSGAGIIAAKKDGKRTAVTSRQAAWLLAGKQLPAKGWVLSPACGEPACCNSAHLQLRTKAEVASSNGRTRDLVRLAAVCRAAAAPRRAPAEKRLQAVQMRRAGHPLKDIAKALGVSLTTAWKHSRVDPLTGAGMP
jgi:hypothetical protein